MSIPLKKSAPKHAAGVTSRAPAANVLVLDHQVAGSGWEQWYLLGADAHIDNPKTDRKLKLKHLEQAKERGARILEFGDWFCAMQGAYDPRKSKKDIRPENNVADYFDSLVTTSADFLAPYRNLLTLFGYGNHETAILKRQETDLIKRLVGRLNLSPGPEVFAGGYTGFVRFQFAIQGTQRQSVRLYYDHGSGGGGPVTRGVIQTNRRAAAIEADIYVSGHIHEAWQLEVPRVRLSSSNRIVIENCLHVQLPTYKEEFAGGVGGFHVEKGRHGKPLGAWWLRFYYEDGMVKYEIMRAK